MLRIPSSVGRGTLAAGHAKPRGPKYPGSLKRGSLGTIEEVGEDAPGPGLPVLRVPPAAQEVPEVPDESLDAVDLEPDDVEEGLDGVGTSVAVTAATLGVNSIEFQQTVQRDFQQST